MLRFAQQGKNAVKSKQPYDIGAVIDTNVLVSALITHNPEAATAKVVRLLFNHGFVPMYDADIIAEYEEDCIETSSPFSLMLPMH